MAKASTRTAQADTPRAPTEQTPLEKMTDLTRRILHVRKDELPNKGKPKKRHRQT
jgi:hypothetical protein